MKKNYLLIAVFTFLVSTTSFGQPPKFKLDFEGVNPLLNLPSGVTNVNGTNTVRVKNTTDYAAIPNAVQSKSTGGNELFIDFQGYLKIDVPTPSTGFSVAYDYRRDNLNDDWWLGFLTFVGNDGVSNVLEKIQIRDWQGQLDFAGLQTLDNPIGFNTNYKIVVTCSATGDIKMYVDNVLKLSVPNSSSGYDIQNWTNVSLLLSFKGESFDGTDVTPESEYALNARDARVFVDNVELYERELTTAQVDAVTFPKTPKYVLDFEGPSPLSNLPAGVTNVNGTNTVRVKNTTNYSPIPNAVQSDGAGGNELFLDYHGYLKMNINPKNGFSLAYDYRKSPEDADWFLGFVTFIGNNGTGNVLEQILLKQYWASLFEFSGESNGAVNQNLETEAKIVVTCNNVGDVKIYVNSVLVLNRLNSLSGKNLHTWTNASILLSFKGNSFDGTNVTPEPEYALNARDTRAFVDNIKLYERELSQAEVTDITYPSFAQTPKFFIDFENANPLANLPAGVANVNGTNTVRVKNTTNYPAIPNAVQSDGAGGNELFLDFQGYLKVNVSPSTGFSFAYDYRRNNANDDWYLGLLSFIGTEGATNKLEQLLIKEWSGQLTFMGVDSTNPYPIWFDTDYKIVVTCSASGTVKVYVDNVLKLTKTGTNINTWTNAGLLLKFKGQSFDGTNVTPENEYASNAKDNRAFVDNIALYEGELSANEVAYISTNGNNSLGTIAWNGSSNSYFNEPTNWTPNGVPSLTRNATITTAGTFKPFVTANSSIKSLNIDASSILTVTSGNNLTVTDAITNNGSLTIANNANLIQTNNVSNSGVGTTTVARNSNLLSRGDYSIWSSPVAGQNLLAFSPATLATRFYNYNETNNKYSVVATPGLTPFVTGEGYLIRMPDNAVTAPATQTFNGVFTGNVNNGNVSKALAYSGATFGYNMVGNPYPSTIDADAFITANTANIESSLYFWRKINGAGGSAYAVYNAIGSTASPSSALPNGTIQVGQGFFVKAKSGATSIDFNNAMRLGTASTQFFKTKAVQKDRLWLNLTNTDNAFSQTLVGYTAAATKGVDDFDAKYFNDSEIALTSSINNEEYSIQGRPSFDATDVVALNFKTNFNGSHTIALNNFDGVFATGQDVYLVDSTTGTETDLKAGSYTFNAGIGVDNARFTLKFQKTLKIDASVFNENSVNVYNKNNSIYVNSKNLAISNIKVFDIQGRLIVEKNNVNKNSDVVTNLKSNNQILIVKIISEDNNVVVKKILN